MNKPEWSKFEYGEEVNILQRRNDTVKFPGWVIGWYERKDGYRGYVLQHRTDRIVHVYSVRTVVKEVRDEQHS